MYFATPIPLSHSLKGTSPLKGEGHKKRSPSRGELTNLKGWSEGVIDA